MEKVKGAPISNDTKITPQNIQPKKRKVIKRDVQNVTKN